MMHVTQLWTYPVKSMVGTTVERVRLDELGVVGDRQWATRDLERGGIRGAKKIGALMRCASRDVGGGRVEITLPDGVTVVVGEPSTDELLSAALGHQVRLESLRPADDLDHYRRGAADSDDMLAELRDIFGREGDEPLPDLSIFPPEIVEFESPPGTYYDAFPLLVITESALAAVAAALPDATVDVRRFRPSIVVGGAPDGHPEFGWVGRRATVGTAEIEIVEACPRCVMVTRAVGDDIGEDRSVLRHVVRELDQNFGVYARVVTPGEITVGDAFELR